MIYATAYLGMVFFYMVPIQVPFLLTTLGASASRVGLMLAATNLVAVAVSLNFSRVRNYLANRTIAAILFLLLGCGYFLISRGQGYTLPALGLAVAGIGMGLLMPTVNVWLAETSPLLEARVMATAPVVVPERHCTLLTCRATPTV